MRTNDHFDPPSERLTRYGVGALCLEELVALILQAGNRGQNGLETARRLARDFGSISRLATARLEELTNLSGVSPAEAAALVASFHLARIAVGDAAPFPRCGPRPMSLLWRRGNYRAQDASERSCSFAMPRIIFSKLFG